MTPVAAEVVIETTKNEALAIEDVEATQATAELTPEPVRYANSTNPRNWPNAKKYRAVLLASLYTFISPISSSMVAPALPFIAADLHITKILDLEMTMSIFILAYAIGPLFLGPLSEIYGRYKILQASLWFFVVFNAVCGLSQTKEQLILFRFLAGLGGSAPIALAGSVVADCFSGAEMGMAMSYYGLGVILAPAVGPILGGFVTQYISWNWVFYAVSIIGGVFAIAGTFLLPETYSPILLAQQQKANGTEPEHKPDPIVVYKTAIVRPFVLLATQPIAQVIALIMAFVYGVMYISLSTFSALFVRFYHQSTQISSLHYLALAVGLFIGNRLSGKVLDDVSKYCQKRYKTGPKPEYWLPLTIPSALLLPLGLLIYGWSAENVTHWIIPDIGIAIFAISVNISFQALTVYTVDVYGLYSASALAAVGCLRSVAGFGFPLFAQDMFNEMGYGWGNSVLALVGIGLGIPAPILLWVYGERLRKASKFLTS
ncbi:UNVERIFIED_CONTAM: hypothetical protein HDU68_010425 [Siphonaria sp. JEL0065]|nr:hypothetical protein HDU68_010425 [Siphonaria sp. JEL0065]